MLLFTRERSPNDHWFFGDDYQVSPSGRVRLPAALLPFLQCALADAICSREFGLGHFHVLPDGLHVNRLRPDLFQLDVASLVRGNELHALDQVRAKAALFQIGRDLP